MGTGLGEIKRAILNADIENHGDHIVPQKYEKQDKPKKAEFDPYDHMPDDELPEIIPGMMMGGGLVRQKTENRSGRRKSSIRRTATMK